MIDSFIIARNKVRNDWTAFSEPGLQEASNSAPLYYSCEMEASSQTQLLVTSIHRKVEEIVGLIKAQRIDGAQDLRPVSGGFLMV